VTYRNLLSPSGVRDLARRLDIRDLGSPARLGVIITRTRTVRRVSRTGAQLVKQFGVFIYVSFAWIFFRADTLSDALLIVRRIFTGVWQDPGIPASNARLNRL